MFGKKRNRSTSTTGIPFPTDRMRRIWMTKLIMEEDHIEFHGNGLIT